MTSAAQSLGKIMSISRETVMSYLEKAFGIDISELQDDSPLFTGGLLDSFSVADLLVFLEDTGKFVVEPEEVVPENLDSVGKIVAYASSKME